MKENLHSSYFIEKYPTLFAHAQKERAYFCGAECGPGWRDLIDRCFKLIIQHVEVNNLYAKSEEEKLDVKVGQLKEKMGGLRIYIDGADDYIQGVISGVEEQSYAICESCGTNQNVNQNKKGWIKTLCVECRTQS